MNNNTNDPLSSSRATNTRVADTIHGILATATPPALWRLIKIGETAGLLAPAQHHAIIDAFGNTERGRESIDRALNHSRRSVTELYILVTLFAAEPRSVGVQTLARETLANSGSLRFALERLEALDVIAREVGTGGEPSIRLTSPGRGLSARLMYSVLGSIASPTPHPLSSGSPINLTRAAIADAKS